MPFYDSEIDLAGIHNPALIFLFLLCIIKVGDKVEFDFEYHLARERTH